MNNTCRNCSTRLKDTSATYCSNKCQCDFAYQLYIDSWKQGHETGIRGIRTFNFSGHLVRYIHEKYNFSCAICSWDKENPYTNKKTLEIDHIDGDPSNNIESNLILLCPNCHSLTSTYKNANKGHGRLWRREKYVKIENVPL